MYKINIRNAETNELLFSTNAEVLYLGVRKSIESNTSYIMYDISFTILNDGVLSYLSTLELILKTNINLEIFKDNNKIFSNDTPLILDSVGSNLGNVMEEIHIVFRKEQ